VDAYFPKSTYSATPSRTQAIADLVPLTILVASMDVGFPFLAFDVWSFIEPVPFADCR